MNVNPYDWAETFRQCYDKAVTLYRLGNRQANSYFNAEETEFLAALGHTAQEVYDFAEDWVKYEAPAFATVVLIAAARRDFFMTIQKCQPPARKISMNELPAKEAAVAGFRWLPRIMAKARSKLRGEMPDDLMYGCGGDRAFLRSVNIHPADFLRVVWAAHDDDHKIIEYVKQRAG